MLAAACDRLLFPRESAALAVTAQQRSRRPLSKRERPGIRAEQQALSLPSAPLLSVAGESPSDGSALASRGVIGGRNDAAESDVVLQRILQITWPILVDRLTSVLVGLVSIVLVGQSGSAAELAAIGLGNVLVNMTALSVIQGLSGAMDTLASQAFGSGEREMVGVYAQRCLLILLLFVVVPAIPVWVFADHILIALHQEAETARLVRQFALVRIPGLVMQVLATVLQKFLNNQGITKPNLWGTLAALPTSLAGSFVLIPWLGFVGAPITNTLVDAARLGALVVALICQVEARQCWGGWSRRCWAGWAGFLALGIPSMVVNCVDWWSGDIANFLYGVQSSNMMAAATIVANTFGVQYSFGASLQTGVSTVVGNALGKGQPAVARRATAIGLLMSVLSQALIAPLYWFLRRPLARLFTTDEGVIALAEGLTPWVIVFCSFDSTQITMVGALTAAGMQKYAAPLQMVGFWLVGLPLAALLAFSHIVDSSYVERYGVAIGMSCGIGCIWLGFLALLFCMVDFNRAAVDAGARLAAERGAEASRGGGALVGGGGGGGGEDNGC